jgi:hypothetical protein
MWDRKCSYRVLVGKPEGKKLLVRPTHRWDDNIKRDLQEVGWGSIDWIDLERARQQALVNVAKTFELNRMHIIT